MRIVYGASTARLTDATDAEFRWIADYLTVTSHNGRAEETFRLFDPSTNTLPAGLVYNIRDTAAEDGHTVELVPQPVDNPLRIDRAADLAWLRDYQRAALDAAIDARRGIIHIPTGGGKTEVIVGLTRALPGRWLALVHRAGLAEQMAKRFELRSPGLRVGRFFDGRREHGDSGFTCVTLQTLHRAFANKDEEITRIALEAQGIVIDEAHTLPAWSFYNTVSKVRNAHYRFGVSGTPLARGDKRNVLTVAAIGEIVYTITTKELIDRGILAAPKIRMVTVAQTLAASRWPNVYTEGIVNSALRNGIVVDEVKRATKPCFVFVQAQKHGRELKKRIEREGMRAEFVYGEDKTDHRERALRDLDAGRLDVLVCSNVFQEGVDLPSLRSIIIAKGTKSVIASLQMVGRGTRLDKGKVDFEVVDFFDQGDETLARHARARRASYVSESYSVTME